MLRNLSADIICYLYKVMSASNLHSFAVIRAKEHYDFDLMCLHIKRELYASRRVNGDTKIIVCLGWLIAFIKGMPAINLHPITGVLTV